MLILGYIIDVDVRLDFEIYPNSINPAIWGKFFLFLFLLSTYSVSSKAKPHAMNYETYQIMLYVLSFLAVIVFVALYFVKAGYGIFRTRSWGWSVPNKVGWILMEAPSFVVMGLWAWKAGVEAYTPQAVFVGLFMLHYFQRSFVFPLLMKGKSRMPLAIMAMGILFNVINVTLLAASFFSCALPGKYEPATFWTNPLPWIGAAIFFIGMAINLHADHVIRNLRKPGDTRHYLPEKGFYRYVTSANYFGELVEWTGFALLTVSPAAWVFVWWTAANLVPRADAIYKRYCEEFGKQAVGSRKRIIPYIY